LRNAEFAAGYGRAYGDQFPQLGKVYFANMDCQDTAVAGNQHREG
jgi:hypothetical protein